MVHAQTVVWLDIMKTQHNVLNVIRPVISVLNRVTIVLVVTLIIL